MEKEHNDNNGIRVFIDPYGNTLNFWWDDPKKSDHSQEAAESWDVIVVNKDNRPIGFEKIGFFPREIDPIKYLKSQMKYLLEAREKLVE